MNTVELALELLKTISVDGKINVDKYCKVLEIVGNYISSNCVKSDASHLLSILDEMIKEQEEKLQKAKFHTDCSIEHHANNKYCLTIVKSLVERRYEKTS
jgi:flagellar biosynthesis chaperone FliJ